MICQCACGRFSKSRGLSASVSFVPLPNPFLSIFALAPFFARAKRRKPRPSLFSPRKRLLRRLIRSLSCTCLLLLWLTILIFIAKLRQSTRVLLIGTLYTQPLWILILKLRILFITTTTSALLSNKRLRWSVRLVFTACISLLMQYCESSYWGLKLLVNHFLLEIHARYPVTK